MSANGTKQTCSMRCPTSAVGGKADMTRTCHYVPYLGRHPSGEVLIPSLSVVSSGTRHPFKNKLSILNQPIISTILREIVSPYLSRSSRKVSSRNMPVFDNSSVALH